MALSKGKIKRQFHIGNDEYTFIVDEYLKKEVRIYKGKNNLILTLIDVSFFSPNEVKKEYLQFLKKQEKLRKIIASEMMLVFKKIIDYKDLGFRNSNTTFDREISIFQEKVENAASGLILGSEYIFLAKHYELLKKTQRLVTSFG